ncbi:YihY/virulence factor BrkB family protein [Undibacter mobilis]|uniref:YihY family inner membrane protein n=1 Tax=Undibacter mobilis TaxID=2292256 RepID=A0A371BAR6_9BRAD|nr:hypothetical protein DXH78_08695 [Undibacter mobilis]
MGIPDRIVSPIRHRPALLRVGAVFPVVAWLGGSALLSWYLASFAQYEATYGSLCAGIGLMMWLWMTVTVVLVGAELNSEIDNEMWSVPEPEEGGIGKRSDGFGRAS